MRKAITNSYPFWITLIVYWAFMLMLLSSALTKTNGHFGYPLDDTYIHMAMGKHLIKDGYWGVSQSGFTSSTSSPLWTFLIAATQKIFGVNDLIPFVLCSLTGIFMIYYCYSRLQKTMTPMWLTFSLLFIMVITPLPLLTLTGMEHVLHSLFTIWLTYSAVIYLIGDKSDYRQLTLILLAAGLTTITRYEGLFLVFSIVLLFLIKKRFGEAVLIGGAGLLPIIIYGTFSLTQGWYFIPNSILLKSNTPALSLKGMGNLLNHLQTTLSQAPHILVLMVACLIIYIVCNRQKSFEEKERYLIVIFLATSFLHLQFAGIGWFYRYEAYLMLTGSLILIDIASPLFKSPQIKGKTLFTYAGLLLIGLFFAMPLAWRAKQAFKDYPFAVMNIYEQQYQMGLFLMKYYSGKTVAANDIGAINYLADIKTLDLNGLASMDVAKAKRNGLYTKDVMNELVLRNNVEIVIIYSSWFEGVIPLEWQESGTWQITNNVVAGDSKVSFYAPTVSSTKEVAENLSDFSELLPPNVKQSGTYITP